MELVLLVIGSCVLSYIVMTIAVRDGTAQLRARQDAQLKLLAAMAVRQGVPPGDVEQIMRDAGRAAPIAPAVSAARGPTP